MIRASAYTLGCKVNQYDTTAMLELLEQAGYQIVPWGERADVYLINTCTVTNIADRKSRSLIRRIIRENPRALVCVCGCLAQDQAQEVAAIDGVDVVVGTDDRIRIVEMLEQGLAGKQCSFVSRISDVDRFEPLQVSTAGEKTRGYVKIQEGCNSFCSYCIIPYVRGNPRSRGIEDVLGEVRQLAQNGVREVVLTGIHISLYGGDVSALLELLKQIDHVEGILRIRMGSLEPQVLTDEFVKRLAGLDKLCPHFHVPLQHGSDAVLKTMNRKYTTGQYRAHIEYLRKYFESPAITTDVITGFPGESEADFMELCRMAEEIAFSHMHVFPYSERKGTVAAAMKNQVPVEVRKDRARHLIKIGEKLEHCFIEQFINRDVEVLLEQREEDYIEGYTSRYVRVHVPYGQAKGRLGDVVTLRLERRVDCHAVGTLVL